MNYDTTNQSLCSDEYTADKTTNVEAKFNSLDRRYQRVQLINIVIVYALLMGLALLLLTVDTPLLCLSVEALLAIVLVVNLCILPRAFRYKGYSLSQQDISYRRGIICPKTTTIPFVRVQQVSMSQNPVSKLYGLYSVEIVNGAQTLVEMSIPGLSEETASTLKNLVSMKIVGKVETKAAFANSAE